MKHGIIVEIGPKHWIVMTADGEFRKIRRTSEADLGDEVRLPGPPVLAARKTIALVAAISVVLLLLTLPNLMRSYSEVAVYLAIDFNPSLELGVDRHERVLELRSWNADGAEMIEGMNYENIAMQEVLGQIVERARAGQYLIEDRPEVIVTSVITGARPDASLEARVAGQVSLMLESALDLTVTVLSAPLELREEAEQQGVTPGKMAVYLLAKHTSDPIMLKELQQFSIHQAVAAHGGMEAILSQLDTAGASEALRRLLQQELAQEAEQPTVPESGIEDPPRIEGDAGKTAVGAPLPEVKPQAENLQVQPVEPQAEDRAPVVPPAKESKQEQKQEQKTDKEQKKQEDKQNKKDEKQKKEDEKQKKQEEKQKKKEEKEEEKEEEKQQKQQQKETKKQEQQDPGKKPQRENNDSQENVPGRGEGSPGERPEKESGNESKNGHHKGQGKSEAAKEKGRHGNNGKSNERMEREAQGASDQRGLVRAA
ncbi:anti-sigma factor domain-containing protein [Paenibacillus daejeonensis]|uniref:anti-sigma factor domain-containing protein n=1 Tax=Paenibacillus daejeonensis TaxID=135193 RepID=UPI000375E9B8|nr:anti-sigma factor domain-containing protein [Paenibacillus daejeonensis]